MSAPAVDFSAPWWVDKLGSTLIVCCGRGPAETVLAIVAGWQNDAAIANLLASAPRLLHGCERAISLIAENHAALPNAATAELLLELDSAVSDARRTTLV